VAKKAFRLIDTDRRYIELYRTTLEAIYQRGNDEALKVLDRELVKRRDDEELIELILSYIPDRSDAFSLSTLLMFLKDPESKAKDAVRAALRRMQVALILPELLNIIKADRSVFPHVVRIQVLLLMGELEMPYCLQTILENLPIIPIQEGRDFAQILAKYPKDLFVNKAEKLLETPDAKIRSALIACLPSTGIRDFLTSIRKSLNDADPDVRIASIWAIVEYNDTRTLNQAFMLLRDPVERVRVEASKALGIMGSDDSLDKLEEILDDENEIIMVKEAVITGLGSSKSMKSIDILTNHLEKENGLLEKTVEALSGKTDKKEITRLIENFKDGSPRARDKLKESFKGMREVGEGILVELLRENIASLNPFIAEILDGTGFVEATIRKLSHRDPVIRKEAAEILSMVGTQSAFRGMVLAAKDPNEEVRVQVIKALEKLETKEGKTILEALESDPDRKIRKYTHWALERIKAKSL
jgi:HEAT repeat protein